MTGDRLKSLIEQLKREQPSLAKDPTFGALEEEIMTKEEGESSEAEADMESETPSDMEGMPEGADAAEGPVPGVVGDSAASDEEAMPEEGVDTTGLYSSFAMGNGKSNMSEDDMNEFSPKFKGKAKRKPSK